VLLDGSQHGLSNWLWEVNRREEGLWIQIVFA